MLLPLVRPFCCCDFLQIAQTANETVRATVLNHRRSVSKFSEARGGIEMATRAEMIEFLGKFSGGNATPASVSGYLMHQTDDYVQAAYERLVGERQARE